MTGFKARIAERWPEREALSSCSYLPAFEVAAVCDYFLSDDEEAAAGDAVGVDVAVAGALLPEELESVLDLESPDLESPDFESPDFEPMVLDPDPLLSPEDFGLALP